MKNNAICDIGIYTNIYASGNKARDGHKLYYATCKICGTVIEKKLGDIKRNNTVCYHEAGYNKSTTKKINDMPSGWINASKTNRRIYDLWKAMLERTTEKYWDKFPCYTGTTVDESWRILSNFVQDIKELNGYIDWINASSNSMMLDKDTIVEGNKHYSKSTCQFISHAESNRDVAKRHPGNTRKANQAFVDKYSIPVRCRNLETGEVIQFSSFKEACRTLELNLRNAWMVLSDKYPYNHSTKGWSIELL